MELFESIEIVVCIDDLSMQILCTFESSPIIKLSDVRIDESKPIFSLLSLSLRLTTTSFFGMCYSIYISLTHRFQMRSKEVDSLALTLRSTISYIEIAATAVWTRPLGTSVKGMPRGGGGCDATRSQEFHRDSNGGEYRAFACPRERERAREI